MSLEDIKKLVVNLNGTSLQEIDDYIKEQEKDTFYGLQIDVADMKFKEINNLFKLLTEETFITKLEIFNNSKIFNDNDCEVLAEVISK